MISRKDIECCGEAFKRAIKFAIDSRSDRIQNRAITKNDIAPELVDSLRRFFGRHRETGETGESDKRNSYEKLFTNPS